MCRNIRPLFNYDPPATDADARASALQYVRKVSGFTRPSAANREAFDLAVEQVAAATAQLLAELTTSAPPRSREIDIARARQRASVRYAAQTAPHASRAAAEEES